MRLQLEGAVRGANGFAPEEVLCINDPGAQPPAVGVAAAGPGADPSTAATMPWSITASVLLVHVIKQQDDLALFAVDKMTVCPVLIVVSLHAKQCSLFQPTLLLIWLAWGLPVSAPICCTIAAVRLQTDAMC